jgi:hypothetical protein
LPTTITYGKELAIKLFFSISVPESPRIFTFYSREDGTQEDATYLSARDVLHLRTTIKMQWRHNCVTSTQTWLGNWLYTPSSHDGASRKFAPMPSAIVIVLANATPLSLHDMLTVGERRK